ncbi:MAG: adenylyltransferase/cytidyltransferase family protein [Nitrospira sp.]|nr:adenylyltransferase/cytidyltransferase family protein [Nitrospira sp.]
MGGEHKIQNLDDLAGIVASLRAQGKKVVHCHGVFDLIHVGHIRHFEEAKRMGDVLVVTLTQDEYVNKGPHRPAFPQSLRAEVLAALGIVDYVAINRWPTAVETIKRLRPNIYAKGPDYKDAAKDLSEGIKLEEEAVKSAGGELRFTEDISFSSSQLLNRHVPLFPPEVSAYLDDFRRRHSAGEIIQYLDSLRTAKVLVVGEAILDEYVYCAALGKSAKEPILAMQYLSRERHAGGSLAIANHLAGVCDHVKLVAFLGATESHEQFVRQSLKPNVKPTFISKADSPTIVKRRYVEQYSVSKVLEIYEMNDALLNENESDEICGVLEACLPRYDVVIAADFGHGLMSPPVVDVLVNRARFLSVNTQINAANVGFHTISKYNRADYICVHEGEIRLDHRDRHADVKALVAALSRRLSCKTIMVTQGKRGTLLYREGEGFYESPSLAIRVVDRLGAGDAVLALSSVCVAQGMPGDILNFVANVVGAQAVTILGNSTSIDRVAILKTVESLLK